MALACRTCSRTNPTDAQFCYYDGTSLGNQKSNVDSLPPGARRFANPFVFPSGKSCGSFDELALACESQWKEAKELLSKGYLEGFLGSLGRADLATSSRQAQQNPDLDRALDDFLAKLPTNARTAPKVSVNPLEINLGQMKVGMNRTFNLQIDNSGMGLLIGSISAPSTSWLAIGDPGAGVPEKHFQCRDHIQLPIQVLGAALRSHNKQQEAKLLIETNGGSVTVIVKVDVPVQPYADNVLAGAKSPRQIAEKAKANPKEAALLIEKGAVAAWYRANGWTYPVQGPPASGVAAVQQYFEALGLVHAPKVEISTKALHLTAPAGGSVESIIQVQTQEKKPVYAYAISTAPWLVPGKTIQHGSTARIPLRIPSVPSVPGGERLQCTVHITANGNQRFAVEVTLSVAGIARPTQPVIDMSQAIAGQPSVLPGTLMAGPDWLPNSGPNPVYPTAHQLPPVPHNTPVLEVLPNNDQLPEVLPVPITRSGAQSLPNRHNGPFQEVLPVEPSRPLPPSTPYSGHSNRPQANVPMGEEGNGFLYHLIPLGALFLLLFGMLIHDLILPEGAGGSSSSGSLDIANLEIDPDPYLSVMFHDGPKGDVSGNAGRDVILFPTMRFGLLINRERGAILNKQKKLTFDAYGRSNNTVIRVDGQDWYFGNPTDSGMGKAKWEDFGSPINGDKGRRSIWFLTGPRIAVTQEVEIAPGEPAPGEKNRPLNTIVVKYSIENRDTSPHMVGIRFLLDTYIGENDGVPFNIPGQGMCDTSRNFNTISEVPDYIEALERGDLRNPGTVARIQFRLGSKLEPPSRVLLGGWPNQELKKVNARFTQALSESTGWEVPECSIQELYNSGLRDNQGRRPDRDSAVTMYWDPRPISPGQTRKVGFTYGLGQVASEQGGGKLLVSVGGRLVKDGEFTVTALVSNPQLGEHLTLELPSGLSLASGLANQPVPPPQIQGTSTVTWKVKPNREGSFVITVRTSSGNAQSVPIVIKSTSIFD